MADPTIGLSVQEVAAKLLEPVEQEPVKEPEAQPEAETSEVVDTTLETSEEVVEETTEAPAEVESTETEIDEYVTGVNDWVKDSHNLDQIRVPTKVNGVESDVSLSEAIASHQIREASEQRLDSLKTEKASFEEERTKFQTSYNGQLTQAANLVTALEKQLTGEAEQINWQELRDTDPAEYSAKRLDFEKRGQELSQSRVAISQEQQTKANETYNSIVTEQSAKLVNDIPEWKDEAKATKEKGEIRDYLLGRGFTQLEVDGEQDAQGNIKRVGLVNANAISMARKAMLFDRGEKQVQVTKKKVKKLPKVTKPGRPISSQEVDSEKTNAMRKTLKKSGKLEDAAAIIKQRMFGG
jgi:hypothetical protein